MTSEFRPAAKSSFNIRFPQQGSSPEQDEELFEFDLNGETEWLHIHDYAGIYSVPGLYEALVYQKLACRSPYHLSSLLVRAVRKDGIRPEELRVLDLGAGNGMVAEELQEVGVRKFVGLDLIEEAQVAADRDRPTLYSEYVVGDVRELGPRQAKVIESAKLNCVVTVAALGFGDIPPSAFTSALNRVSPCGWLGMTIKEEFLGPDCSAGFGRLIERLEDREVLEICSRERYCHRLSVTGAPIFYIALVARKFSQVPDDVLAEVYEADGWVAADQSETQPRFGT